jgi:hypothetical protein
VTVAARRELPELSDGDLKLLQERGETFRDRFGRRDCSRPGAIARFPAAMALGPGCHERSDCARLRCPRWLLSTRAARGVLSTPEHEVPTSVSSGIVSLEPAAVRNASLNRG